MNFIFGVDMSKVGAGIVVRKSSVTLAIAGGTKEPIQIDRRQVSIHTSRERVPDREIKEHLEGSD